MSAFDRNAVPPVDDNDFVVWKTNGDALFRYGNDLTVLLQEQWDDQNYNEETGDVTPWQPPTTLSEITVDIANGLSLSLIHI